MKGKKFTLTAANIQLLLAFVGVAVFLAGYLLGYQKLSEKNDTIEADIRKQSAVLDELKNYESNAPLYRSGIEDSKSTINKLLSRLPIDILPEDYLLWYVDFHNHFGLELPSISVTTGDYVTDFTTVINGQSAYVSGYRAGSTFQGEFSYKGLKDFIKYVYSEDQPVTFLNNISFSYDGSTGLLNVTASLSRYYINYEGAVYVPYPTSYPVTIGTDDPFNTISSGRAVLPETAPQAETNN
ncbi:MAG: hypothetical protein K6B52_02685 [Clostridiales bacterium]|nr:hypothetical protein [Clostridiales bacterium]